MSSGAICAQAGRSSTTSRLASLCSAFSSSLTGIERSRCMSLQSTHTDGRSLVLPTVIADQRIYCYFEGQKHKAGRQMQR